MSKKTTPQPIKKLATLKNKLKQYINHMSLFAKEATMLLIIVSSFGYLLLKGPEIHGLFLRTVVGSKTYQIKGNLTGGGGTGFAVKAPSGVTYIVTNSHVCEGALTQSDDKTALLVVNEQGALRRKIIEISNFTDLCILEGLPGVTGLSVGSQPALGEIVAAVGYPLLRPLSISRGEIVGKQDVQILSYVMKSGDVFKDLLTDAQDGACDSPKNQIVEDSNGFLTAKLCLTVTKDADMSTIVIYPGNSGSPIVDFFGRVTSVAFASDRTNWAVNVSNADLKKFLSRY